MGQSISSSHTDDVSPKVELGTIHVDGKIRTGEMYHLREYDGCKGRSRSRLEELKEEKFLTMKIFERLSENMHYEVFKYVNAKDLLVIRSLKLGGYLLSSNKLLRSRIKNYFSVLIPRIIQGRQNIDMNINMMNQRIKLIFEQLGSEIIDLKNMQIDPQRMYNNLVPLLKLNYGLIGLKLDYNDIKTDGVNILAQHFNYIPNLQILNLSMNNIETTGMVQLSKQLELIPQLRILVLGGNRIEYDGIVKFTENIKCIRNLEALVLWGNKIGPDGAQLLAEHFQFIPQLVEFNLMGNLILTKGATKISKNLKYIPYLNQLCLRNNGITADGAIILADNLKYIPNLEKLDLGGNSIRNSGIQDIVMNLKYIGNLKTLDLCGTISTVNNTGQKLFNRLVDHLELVPNLIKLDLGGNGFKEPQLQKRLVELFPKISILFQ